MEAAACKTFESMELEVELTGSKFWNRRSELENKNLMQSEPDLELGSEGAQWELDLVEPVWKPVESKVEPS